MDKISIRIDGIEDEWSELDQHIDCPKSEFLRQCILKHCKEKFMEETIKK